jgi:hypothetical protein
MCREMKDKAASKTRLYFYMKIKRYGRLNTFGLFRLQKDIRSVQAESIVTSGTLLKTEIKVNAAAGHEEFQQRGDF